MKKFAKILAGILLSIVVLIAAGITALILLVNPNDYKPQLQTLAKEQQVELNIEGDLAWSFYPQLGIRAGKFSVKPAMKQITKPLLFDSFILAVKVLPLLHRQIIVDKIAIHGTEISMHDEVSGNDSTIKNLLIESRDLNLQQQAFPLSISLQASTTQPQHQLTLKINTHVSVDQDIKHIDLNSLSIKLDDTTLMGDIHLVLGSVPSIKLTLAGDTIDVDHYLASDSTTSKEDNKDHSSKIKNKSADDELIPVNTLKTLPGEYALSFKSITLQHMHVTDFDVHTTISAEGLVDIEHMKTNLYGGEFSLKGKVDARSSQPAVQLALSLSPLQLEPALKDYLQADKTFVSGDLAFNANITTQGLTQNQLMKAVNGDFSFASQSLTLNKVDLTSSLDASLLQLLQVKLPKLMSEENKTVLSNLAGKGLIQQGVLNNTSLSALGPCLQMNGAGTYNLLNADVDYHLGIIFPSANTEKLCSDINKNLKDISWPIVCKGSLDKGAANICAADNKGMQTIVKKEVGNKAEQEINKQLDKKFGKDAEGIKNALKGFF